MDLLILAQTCQIDIRKTLLWGGCRGGNGGGGGAGVSDLCDFYFILFYL